MPHDPRTFLQILDEQMNNTQHREVDGLVHLVNSWLTKNVNLTNFGEMHHLNLTRELNNVRQGDYSWISKELLAIVAYLFRSMGWNISFHLQEANWVFDITLNSNDINVLQSLIKYGYVITREETKS